MRLASALLLLATAAWVIACDTSVQVGQLRQEDVPPNPGFTPVRPPDAGTSRMEWRSHGPSVPCSIYALEETPAGIVYLGCDNGRIYRFDGVTATVAFDSGIDTNVFSLLWVSPSGEVWAAATTRDEAKATQLYHFDRTSWLKVGDASKQLTSLTGAQGDVFVTTDTQIFRYERGALVPVFTTNKGAFRACEFSATDQGYCVGTQGLAIGWNGTSWSPAFTQAPNVPWSQDGEVFGLEYDSWKKTTTFFYGEPLDAYDGDHTCRVAHFSGSAFDTSTASIPCFASSDIPRKRTGQVSLSSTTFMLLAPDPDGLPLAFNPKDDTVTQLCAPTMAFARGASSTRAAGAYGFLATIVGVGGAQFGFDASDDSYIYFKDLSVAPNGSAWARIENRKACGSTEQLVRYDNTTWTTVAASPRAASGNGLAALAYDRAYTLDIFNDALLFYDRDTWTESPVTTEQPQTLFANKPDDVWIGGSSEDFGHFDGKTFTEIQAAGRQRQVEQILPVGEDVWMLQWGTAQDESDQHVVRWSKGVLTDWSAFIHVDAKVRLSAVDEQHVFRSGAPAMMWNGTEWRSLEFDANGVWARAADEVYFTYGGDIWRWDGHERTRVYHGFIPIKAIAGSPSRGFAVGPGGLTIEFAESPTTER